MAFVPVGLADQGVTFAQYEQGDYEAPDTSGSRELTDAEVESVLNGDYTALGLTADAASEAAEEADEQTGAMIALLPSEDDMNRLVVDGGEDDEDLHLTLCYLGEAAKITPMMRNDIIESVRHMSRNVPIIDADGFGVAAFNQDQEKEPCVVLLVSGDELKKPHMMADNIASDYLGDYYPPQYEPWIPHITLAYTSDSGTVKKLKDREGPIRFDHVRVAFGGEVTDFPLYDGTASTDTVAYVAAGGKESSSDKKNLEVDVVTADAAVDLEAELGEYDGGWEGPLVVEDTDTGDQRMFSGGSLTWEDTESIIHPFQWAQSNLGEHKGSVTAGRIDKMWRSPENPRVIMGKGRFNINDPDGLRAFRQVRDGFAGGVSVDPDQVTDADVELEFALGEDNDPFAKPTKTIFHKGRLRGATLVAFPALVEAAIKLTKKGESSAVVASVTDAPWKSIEHELRLGEGELDGLVAAAAFAYVDGIDDVVSRQQCRFLHHEIDEDGQPGRASLVACAKHIGSINSGRAFGLTTTQLKYAYDHMAQHFTDAGQIAPAFTLQTESMVAAAIPATAPLEWFGKPELYGPTPVTVTEDGRVFGHAACWGTCHTGFADTCVTPPAEPDYSYFTTGEVLTAEGHSVAVGQITLGTSHAPTRGVTLARAIDHYGDTGTAVADVTAGTDEHGIWIAGAVRPGTSSEHMHALRASALSGDWRRISGNLRMVALLAVNVPGFPIPRVGTALAQGKQVSLVAAGVVDRTTMSLDDELAALDMACGISAATKKPKLKYATLESELADLDKF